MSDQEAKKKTVTSGSKREILESRRKQPMSEYYAKQHG